MFKIMKYQLEYIWARLDEKGQGIVEYALILAAVVAIATIALSTESGIGNAISDLFNSTGEKIRGGVNNTN